MRPREGRVTGTHFVARCGQAPGPPVGRGWVGPCENGRVFAVNAKGTIKGERRGAGKRKTIVRGWLWVENCCHLVCDGGCNI